MWKLFSAHCACSCLLTPHSWTVKTSLSTVSTLLPSKSLFHSSLRPCLSASSSWDGAFGSCKTGPDRLQSWYPTVAGAQPHPGSHWEQAGCHLSGQLAPLSCKQCQCTDYFQAFYSWLLSEPEQKVLEKEYARTLNYIQPSQQWAPCIFNTTPNLLYLSVLDMCELCLIESFSYLTPGSKLFSM